MEVTEAAQNPSTELEEAIKGNLSARNAATMQYLESARGHYFSALAGLTAGKQEQTRSSASIEASLVLEDNGSRHLTGKGSMMEEPGRLMRFPESFMVQSNQTVAENTRADLEEAVDKLGFIGKTIGRMDAADLGALTTAPLEFGDAKESLLERILENSSIQKTVESLKAELEILKRQHAELKDRDVEADIGPKNSELRYLLCEPELIGCHSERSKSGNPCKEESQHQNGVKEVEVKTKGLKREHNALNIVTEIQKKPRVALGVNEAKKVIMSAFDTSMDIPERMYAACVSTSESSARIMNSEDELESSSQKLEKLDCVERESFMGTKERIGVNNCDYVSEFSIRDFVFSARNKDISANWPFSEKILTLCLKHGLKEVLPPFQPVDSWRDDPVERCLVVQSVPSEESNLNVRPSVMKKHLLPKSSVGGCWNKEPDDGYRSDQFQSKRGKVLAFRMAEMANCESEVESVSTNNLPSSEVVSDEREASVSAAVKAKCSSSQISKKGRALKSHMNDTQSAPEDITSACTVKAKSSKICPVCENFSSSSNTTLNAHIDQCLSSQSSPHWVKNSELLKPRIKPRKMRLMADICATTPSCTLEDLDRRNGTNWASNVDFSSEDAVEGIEGTNRGLCSRYVVRSRNDGSVYIDSNGRKICILSKFNETMSSSFSKPGEDLNLKKQSKTGKRRKFFSASRKRSLAKHIKYLRVSRQRKRFMSRKVKARLAEGCRVAKITCVVGETSAKQKSASPYVKQLNGQEHKIPSVLGTSNEWKSSNLVNLQIQVDSGATTKACRYDLRTAKDRERSGHTITGRTPVTQSLGATTKACRSDLRTAKDMQRSGHTITGRTPVKKNSRLPEKPPSYRQCSLSPVSDYAGVEHKSPGLCCGRTLSSPPNGEVEGNRVNFLTLASGRLSRKNTTESVQRSFGCSLSPASSLGKQVEFQSDSVRNTDPRRGNLFQGCHAYPLDGSRPFNSESGMLSPNLLDALECQSNSNLKGSADNSCDCSEEEAGTCFDGTGEQVGGMQVLGKEQDGSKETARFGDFTDVAQDNYCFDQSVKTWHDNRTLVASISSACLAVGETCVTLNKSLVPQSKNYSLSDSCSDNVQLLDKSQGSELRDDPSYFPHRRLRDESDVFYANATVVERLDLKTGDATANFDRVSSFVEIDPIPIPGPPGSDLPSFSDMGSEDLNRTTSLSNGLVRSLGDADNGVDGDLSDSPLSATSAVANLSFTDDPTFNKEEYPRATLPVCDSAYQGLLVASAGSSVDNPTLFPQFLAARSDWLASATDNLKDGLTDQCRGMAFLRPDDQCCCSRKEGISWSDAMNFQESHLLGCKAASLVSFSGGQHVDSLIKWPSSLNGTATICSFSSYPGAESQNSIHYVETLQQKTSIEIGPKLDVPFFTTGDSDSASTAPILRLMGKDLMVVNKDNADQSMALAARNVCTNKQMHLLTKFCTELEGSCKT